MPRVLIFVTCSAVTYIVPQITQGHEATVSLAGHERQERGVCDLVADHEQWKRGESDSVPRHK